MKMICFKLGIINCILSLIFFYIAKNNSKDIYINIDLIFSTLSILFLSITFYKECKTDIFEEIERKYKR